MRPGRPAVESPEVSTAEAARFLGLSQRRVEQLCLQGVLAREKDWFRMRGVKKLGKYRIRRESVLRLRYGKDSPAR